MVNVINVNDYFNLRTKFIQCLKDNRLHDQLKIVTQFIPLDQPYEILHKYFYFIILNGYIIATFLFQKRRLSPVQRRKHFYFQDAHFLF